MSWNTDLGVVHEPEAPSIPARLHDCVALKRAEFEKENNLSALREEMKRLQRAILAIPDTARWRIHEKLRLKEEADHVAARYTRVQSGEAKAQFERTIAPYVKEYERLGGSGGGGAGGDTSGGLGKRKRGEVVEKATAAVRHGKGAAGSTAARRYDRCSLRDEFVTHLMGQQAPVLVENRDACDRCNVNMVVLATEALLACPKCSRTRLYVQTTSQQIAYGEEVREFTSFSYKRHNHFQDWLNAFQAKESAEVPLPVVERVMTELHGRRFCISTITSKKVREVLKDLKLRKYYDHTAQITARITGKPPPRMTPQQEEQCRLMFRAVETSFEVHCPAGRRNFLSYSFCLFKFCELLGWRHFLPCFSLLKGKEKLARQDQIYKAICADLDWEFVPSM